MLTLRRCVAVLLMSGVMGACSGGSGSPGPRGQELREELAVAGINDATHIQSRGCVGPDSERNYRRQGLWEFFYRNGQKSGEGSYVDGNQGGETDSTGILLDCREGLWTLWHENGQKKEEATYRDGRPFEGPYTRWYANGQKSLEATYRDGQREGLETMWHANGQKSVEVTYLNGTETSRTEWRGGYPLDENGNQITHGLRVSRGVDELISYFDHPIQVPPVWFVD